MSMKDFFVNQQEIAEHFGVNRTTVRAWTKRGLPYLEADQGKPGRYHIGHTLWWVLGGNHLERIGFKESVSGLDRIMLARIMSNERDGFLPGDEKDTGFDKNLEVYGYAPEEIAAARNRMAGFLLGRGVAASFYKNIVNGKKSVVTENAPQEETGA